jgi:hypothetical protein
MARLRRLAEKPAVKDTLQAVHPPGVDLKTRRIATNQHYEPTLRTNTANTNNEPENGKACD